MWGAILGFLLAAGKWGIDLLISSKKRVKDFFAFVKKVGSSIASMRLMKMARKQLEWFKKNPEFKETINDGTEKK